MFLMVAAMFFLILPQQKSFGFSFINKFCDRIVAFQTKIGV